MRTVAPFELETELRTMMNHGIRVLSLVSHLLMILAMAGACLGSDAMVLCLGSDSHSCLGKTSHRTCSTHSMSTIPELGTWMSAASSSGSCCHCSGCVDLVVDGDALGGESKRLQAPNSDLVAAIVEFVRSGSPPVRAHFGTKTEGLSPHLAELESVVLLT